MMRTLLVVSLAAALTSGAAAEWRKAAPMPSPRSEVAAAPFRGGIAVVGGFSPGRTSRRVDLHLPKTNRWRPLPDLPLATNHAAAASFGGKLYVLGGYGSPRPFLRAAFVLEGRRWRKLRSLPAPRGAAAAAIVDGKLYLVGGVAPAGLATTAFVLDLRTEAWSKISGPTPREHLAVASAQGRVYALAGHQGGLDLNVGVFESYSPEEERWTALPPVPGARSGTGLAHVAGTLVSVGGEGPNATTIETVFGFDLASRRWSALPDLPTPRHGMAVAAVGTRVYAIGGSPVADLGFSTANEYLELAP
jgi:non-specific serine/threonine protein kinase